MKFMHNRSADQKKAAWFESNFCVFCALYI